MATLCPTCRASFPDDDVNVGKDVAYCKACDKAYTLSELASGREVLPPDLASPPKGAWYRDEGSHVSMGSTWRSFAVGGFFLVFAAFWNTITWGMIAAMLMGGKNVSGPGITTTNGVTTVGAAAYLFMIPFVLVGLGMASAAITVLFGRVELTVRGQEVELFRGVGSIGRRTRFDLTTVTGVRIKESSIRQNGRPMHHISVDGPGITFGAGLNDNQKQFLAGALRGVAGV